MFTGIIEGMGTLESIRQEGGNRSFYISSPITGELKTDQSLSHNGICLTVEEVTPPVYKVTAVAETLSKSTAGSWKTGDKINLERSMVMNGRLDGHLVQGHVDTTAICQDITGQGGSWLYDFRFQTVHAALLIEKGSVCLNGISLTVFNVTKSTFSVAVIPFTYEHTNLKFLEKGGSVNIEFDMIGKYVTRLISLRENQ
jgi:riboflavin synthase